MATRKIKKTEVNKIYYYTIGTEWQEEGSNDLYFIDSTIVKTLADTSYNKRALEVLEGRGSLVIITNPKDIETLRKGDEEKVYVNTRGESMTDLIKADKERIALENKNKALEKQLADLTKGSTTKKTTTTTKSKA